MDSKLVQCIKNNPASSSRKDTVLQLRKIRMFRHVLLLPFFYLRVVAFIWLHFSVFLSFFLCEKACYIKHYIQVEISLIVSVCSAMVFFYLFILKYSF